MSLLRKPLAALVVAGALVFSGPAPAGAKVATGCAKTYTVVPNDSWNLIAGKVHVSMSLLLKVNKASTKSLLLIGDVICLPTSATTKAPVTPGMHLKAPAKRYSVKQSTAIIREIFPDHLEDQAIAISQRETHLNAASWNSCCVGLFQINWESHKSWLAAIGITSAQQLLDARVNVTAALALYKRSHSWSAWK
ncbi:MAG: LysM peptidoglycan-binding domain-containing protein [Actinobacteria bacterium]|nr:LysM peptidoglycan-binding domain-containing protein [Actinomycetota bacterium]